MAEIGTVYKIKASGLSQKYEHRRASVSFGDGYEQRSLVGVNSLKESWSVTFTDLDSIQKNNLLTIINDARGVDAVDWIAPGQSSLKKWLITDVTVAFFNSDFWEVSCNMKEITEY